MMVGHIIDSFLGHIQIHRKGYLASIDTLPLSMNLKPLAVNKIEKIIKKIPEIETCAERIKFGGMFSNFVETTNIRINGVFPDKEIKTMLLFLSRIKQGKRSLKKEFVKSKRVKAGALPKFSPFRLLTNR